MNRQVAHVGIAFGLVLACVTATAAGAQPQVRRVRVTVVDKRGNPVTDMKAEEFSVKDGGAVRDVAGVGPATGPFRISIIVADGGSGAYRDGVAHFLGQLLQGVNGHATVSLTRVIEEPEKLLDYTNDVDKLLEAIKAIGPTPTGRRPAAQLMDAVSTTVRTAGADGARPVILVMRVGGEADSSQRPDGVREDLRKSGAALYVVTPPGVGFVNGSGGAVGGGGDNMSAARSQFANSALAERGMNLGLVLQDGSKDSGGRAMAVAQKNVVATLEQLANELLNQYELAYVVPDGETPSDRLSVSTTRKDVKVYAPSRIPD